MRRNINQLQMFKFFSVLLSLVFSINASSFGTHTLRKEIDHLPLSLETKRAYLNIPNELKESHAMDIIGGFANILSILIESASTSQLQQIQQIIKLKYSSNIINKEDNNACNEQSIDQHKYSLSDISNDSISHICGYLDRQDIKSFKLTSYQNGIACLREMIKCNVSISNINEIINDTNHKYMDELGVIMQSNYTYNRYCANMTYLSLRQIWNVKYKIPLNKQLLLSENDIMCRFYDTDKNNQMSTFKIREIPTRKWLLFDKRHTIKFDEITNQAKIMDVCNEKKQCISFIKWFDIYFQEIIPLQFVMGNHQDMTINRLTKYIENDFIATTVEQKHWHCNVLKYFHRMDSFDSNYPKLMVYKEYKNKLQRFVNPNEKIQWWTICIFQLNTSHPAFNKKLFTNIKEKYNLLQ